MSIRKESYAINNYSTIFSGLIKIVLPGFEGKKSLQCCLTGNLNVKEHKNIYFKTK